MSSYDNWKGHDTMAEQRDSEDRAIDALTQHLFNDDPEFNPSASKSIDRAFEAIFNDPDYPAFLRKIADASQEYDIREFGRIILDEIHRHAYDRAREEAKKRVKKGMQNHD